MRKPILFLLYFILSTAYRAPVASDPTKIPRTVSIGPCFSMSALEVTVEEWMQFIVDNRFDPSLFPDENAFPASTYKMLFAALKNADHDRYFKVAHNGDVIPKYSWWIDQNKRSGKDMPLNYPITGITQEQAIRFCKWKEGKINADRHPECYISIDLPSIELYKRLIENIDSLGHGKEPCWNFRFNYRHPLCNDGHHKPVPQGQEPVRADAYWPSRLGLYNLQGNAAEMTVTPGVAMGGSFRHYAWQSHSNQAQTYSKPEEWLGFRYVVTKKGAQ